MSDIMISNAHIGALQDYPEGEIRPAKLQDGKVIAIYNVEGRICATADQCTHGEASLSEEGTLDGHIVECPWHYGTFDVFTGKATGLPCTHPLQTYEVDVVDGQVYVRL